MRIQDNYGQSNNAAQLEERDKNRRSQADSAQDPDKIKRFNQILEGDEPDQQQGQSTAYGGKAGGKGESSSLSSIFSSLNEKYTQEGSGNNPDLSSFMSSSQGQQVQGGTISQMQGTPQVSSPDELLQLAQNLTDKILVSKPDLSGNSAKQVMISVNQQILPNTTISMSRDVNGMLFVSIVSSDPQSYKKLQETQLMLENSLDKHEKSAFRVELSYNGAGSEAEDNNNQTQDLEYQGYSQRNV
ncbi:MAG: hypothetical protein K6F05_03810 [Succinivibrio sp.]|nr:hypothetical protein [Succinivibrio sp.]